MAEQLEPTGANLIHELQEAGSDQIRIIAILWTWLERRSVDLGSIRDKAPAIRRAAQDDPPFEIIDGALRLVEEAMLREMVEDAVSVAARLLARICHQLGTVRVSIAQRTLGFGAVDVIVAWRSSELAKALSEKEFPPSADENPSLTAIAPTLLVCPVELDGVELQVEMPGSDAFEIVKTALGECLAGEGREPSLEVHLDTLGPHGLSGWVTDDAKAGIGHYDADQIEALDEQACVEAAREAVRAAAGPASILVMPELAATEPVRSAIAEELDQLEDSPLITVFGLRHSKASEEDKGRAEMKPEQLGDFVNEAVAYGPDGEELWRHRKLTYATESVGSGRKESENLLLGDRFTVVPTAVGNLGVLICLDAFADHSRARLAKSPADLILVPSLSPGVHRHQNSLQHLVQLLFGSAFVCNRSPRTGGDSVWNADENRSFWAIQRRPLTPLSPQPDEERPSFVFRAKDEVNRNRAGS